MSTPTRPPAQQTAGQPEASRRGAHRARAQPFLAGLPILAGILIVVLAVGGTWYVLGGKTTDSSKSQNAAIGNGADDEPTGTSPASAGSTASATPSSSKSSSSTGTKGGADGGSSADIDRSIPVRVLNGTSTGGLAKQYATTVEGKGWTVKGTGNTVTKGLATTTVYYNSAADRASAKALLKNLGLSNGGQVELNAAVAQGNLVVALGQDAVG